MLIDINLVTGIYSGEDIDNLLSFNENDYDSLIEFTDVNVHIKNENAAIESNYVEVLIEGITAIVDLLQIVKFLIDICKKLRKKHVPDLNAKISSNSSDLSSIQINMTVSSNDPIVTLEKSESLINMARGLGIKCLTILYSDEDGWNICGK